MRPVCAVGRSPLLALLGMRFLVGDHAGDHRLAVSSVGAGLLRLNLGGLLGTDDCATLSVATEASFVVRKAQLAVAAAARLAGEVVAQAKGFRLFPQHNPHRRIAVLALG